MEKEKDSKLKQAMKGLDSFLTTHYSFRYNQITEQCEFHDKHKFDKYRVVDEREFNTLVINAIEEGVNCMDRDMRRYLGSSRIPSFHPVTAYLEHLPHWDGHDRVSELARSVSDETQWVEVFHIWMLGMVMQWSGKNRMHGNCLIPILVNPLQGLKKSTFCRSLLPPALRGYYTDDFDVTREGDALRKMRSLALINIDEFNRMEEGKLARLNYPVQNHQFRYHRLPDHQFHPHWHPYHFLLRQYPLSALLFSPLPMLPSLLYHLLLPDSRSP